MSDTVEQKFWKRVKKNLTKFGVHLERIENMAGTGTPDVDALCNGVFTKIELKAVDDYPKRKSTPVLGRKGLSVVQKNWQMEWLRHGGRSLILIAVGSHDFYAMRGAWGDKVNSMPKMVLEDLEAARNWTELASLLGAKEIRPRIIVDEL